MMIEFKNITKTYGPNVVVENFNLTIKSGELCILLGESGSGKSTTLNMVNRLIEPDNGEILIDGKNIKDFDINELRRKIGYVVQSVSLFPHMTVGQNIAIVPNLLKWDSNITKDRIAELISLVGLDVDNYINKYPAQLSGGEAQRIGVARALAADPSIILMDEPFGAVDPLNRTNLQNELLQIQKNLNKTIIFVTHDITEAIRLGDKIAVMSDGVIQNSGTAIELVKDQENKFINEFFGQDSFINILAKYNVAELAVPGEKNGNQPVVSANINLKDALAIMIKKSVTEVYVEDINGIITIDLILNIVNQS